jgi:hypothetical protein
MPLNFALGERAKGMESKKKSNNLFHNDGIGIKPG